MNAERIGIYPGGEGEQPVLRDLPTHPLAAFVFLPVFRSSSSGQILRRQPPREVDPNPGPHGAQNEGGHEAERGSDPPPDRPAHRRPDRPDDSFHITGLRAWSVPESGGTAISG